MFVTTCNNEKLRQGRVILPELFFAIAGVSKIRLFIFWSSDLKYGNVMIVYSYNR